MRFAHIAGLTALVYINLIESEFLLSYSSEPVYKKDLTEREVHTANGLVNKSVFRRVKKEGKIAFIRDTKINESDIKVRISLTEDILQSNSYAKYQQMVRDIAKKEGVPYAVIAAMIEQESSWNQTNDTDGGTLMGDKGTAFGLGQIRKLAHQEANDYVGRKLDLHDPADNVTAMTAYLNRQVKRYGAQNQDGTPNWNRAIRQYNAGPSGKGGQQYAKDVAEKMKKYMDSFSDPQGHNKQTGTVAPKPLTPRQ